MILGLFCGALGTLAAQRVTIRPGFLRTNDLRAIPDTYRPLYVMGVVDGMMLSPFFTPAKLDALNKCTDGMTGEQVGAIVSKYIQAHPERWHEDSHVITYAAMVSACPAMSK